MCSPSDFICEECGLAHLLPRPPAGAARPRRATLPGQGRQPGASLGIRSTGLRKLRSEKLQNFTVLQNNNYALLFNFWSF